MLTAVGAEDNYRFGPIDEAIDEPWHSTYLPNAPTPEGEPNPPADLLNRLIEAAFEDRLDRTLVKRQWRDAPLFFHWGVWAALSPDSVHRDDPRLPQMLGTWLQHYLDHLAEPEDDEKVANRITDIWKFQRHTAPLLALDGAPALRVAIGEDMVARYREIVVASITAQTDPDRFNRLLDRSQGYVNMATHPIALFVDGWLLTGETRYRRMAESIVHILHRDVLPNGTFPYRKELHGPDHLEWETMYYHAINVRALFQYWWASDSPMALEALERSRSWYPLAMEPPYHFNAGPDVWWKRSWRTFWPIHVAMVAAATGDGENASIARAMAADNKSHDKFDLVLGALAFNRMATIESKPVRDDYMVEDPDIRGLRLRASPWSATVTAGSFTFTRASAMLVQPDGKHYDALNLARPLVRVADLRTLSKVEPNYAMLGAAGAPVATAIDDDAAAAVIEYRLSRNSKTWRDTIPTAPWLMTEVWLLSPVGLIGLIDSESEAEHELREISHQFRFIVHDDNEVEDLGDSRWRMGDLRFTVHATDFPHHVRERVDRAAMNIKDRRDHQISLVDTTRLPIDRAQTAEKELSPEELKRLPDQRMATAGERRASLISVVPQNATVEHVERLDHPTLIGFLATLGGRTHVLRYNPTKAMVNGIAPGRIHLEVSP